MHIVLDQLELLIIEEVDIIMISIMTHHGMEKNPLYLVVLLSLIILIKSNIAFIIKMKKNFLKSICKL